jgi:hypothetical protein
MRNVKKFAQIIETLDGSGGRAAAASYVLCRCCGNSRCRQNVVLRLGQ